MLVFFEGQKIKLGLTIVYWTFRTKKYLVCIKEGKELEPTVLLLKVLERTIETRIVILAMVRHTKK